MDAELAQLETRLEQMISLYAKLKAENRELHALVVRLEAEKHALEGKVKSAVDRVEALLEQLPES